MLSSVRYVLTSPAPVTFSFGSLELLPDEMVSEDTQINVTLNGSPLTITTDYTVNEATDQITIVGATAAGLGDGDVVIISRETKKDVPYVTFVNNSLITADDLNLTTLQTFFIAQEAYDLASNALQKDPTETYWDAKGISIENASPATTGNGLVTKNQVYDIMGGAETASVDSVEEWCLTGDGILDTFALPGIRQPSTSCEYLVTIDGHLIHCTCPTGGSWSSSPHSSGSGSLSEAQATLVDDTFPTGVCITSGPTAAATIVTNLTALKTSLEAEHLTTGMNYGIAASSEFYGTLDDAIAFFTTGAGAAGNGYYKYCPSDVSIIPIAYNIDSTARTIEFSYPPKAGWKIQVRAWVGTVRADFAEESINGSALRNATVTYDKLTADANFAAVYRFVVFDTNGLASVSTISSAHIVGFDTSVRLNRLDQMAVPTASVSLNWQKITALTSGTTTYEAVNYGQLTGAVSTINSTISVLQSNVSGPQNAGFDQNYAGTPSDLFFQNSFDSRSAITPPSLCDVTKWRGVVCKEARRTSAYRAANKDLDDPVLKYFVPRRVTLVCYGRLYNVDASGNPTTQFSGTDLNHVFRFERWDESADVGFYPYVSVASGVYKYLLSPAEYAKDGADRENGNSLPGGASAYLEIETTAPFRTWLCFEDGSGNPLALCKAATPATRGVIQIIAERGL